MNKTHHMNQINPSRLSRSSVLRSLPSMALSPQHSAQIVSRTALCVLALLCLVGTACSTTAPTGKILFDDPRGTVSLQTVSDRSIQATHPINLDPALLVQILQGMEIQDQAFGLQKLFTGPTVSTPVFSEDQIRFLAPLLAEGLRAAAPDQSVAYRVQATYEGTVLESSVIETTTGSLYAFGRQLHLTLSQYRSSPVRASQNVGRSTARPRPPDYSGLRDRILVFAPKAALRPDGFDPPAGAKSTDRFLVVDYELVQHASPAVATTERTAPQMERRESPAGTGASVSSSQTTEALAQREAEIHTLKDLVNKNASEVETLRKELQSVQQQLGSQTAGPDSPKRKTAPQQK